MYFLLVFTEPTSSSSIKYDIYNKVLSAYVKFITLAIVYMLPQNHSFLQFCFPPQKLGYIRILQCVLSMNTGVSLIKNLENIIIDNQ